MLLIIEATPQQCPESHLIRTSHLQNTIDGHLSCSNKDSTVTTVFPACIWEMRDFLSISCSLSLQSFNIFVKRAGVPFCSDNYCFKPPCSKMSVSWGVECQRPRESDTITDSSIDHHCSEWEQVQDDGIGIGKMGWWVSSLLFCPEPKAEICSLNLETSGISLIQEEKWGSPSS